MILQLTKDQFTLIDEEDYIRISTLGKWQAIGPNKGKYYAVHNTHRNINGKRTGITLLLHRFLTNAPEGMEVDHINGDSLDNRKFNLRICTKAQNRANVPGKPNHRSSQYKGVRFKKDHAGNKKAWEARIKTKHIGYYATELEAAIAYNQKALEFDGDFAYINKLEVHG